jgi:putative ABC transport system permease protein
MSLLETLRFALRAMSGHRLRTVLSLLGVTIGVAAVIVLTALGEGARRYVIEQFASLGTNLVIVVPGKTETTGIPGIGGAPNDLTLDDTQALMRRVHAAQQMAPMSMGTAEVRHRDLGRQVVVLGTTRVYRTIRDVDVAHGEFLPELELDRGSPVVVLGSQLADELFRGIDPLGRIVRIDDWRMRVIGVMAPQGTKLGMNFDEIAIVPVATAMSMFNRHSLFRIIIQSRSAAELDTTKREAIEVLEERHGEEDVTVLTQDAVLSTFASILATLTLVVAAIAAISLSVAGIGIMNVMLVAVSQRAAEIGLLKAVGVSRGQILAVFLSEAGLLSSAGGLAGLAVGYSLVRLMVRLYPALPASPPLWATTAAMSIAIAVGVVFGLLPARQAARLDPVRTLGRHG